jgi:multimeric flavodoxin WrbA
MKDFTQFLIEEKSKNTEFKSIFDFLEDKKNILFLTTSNRWKPEEKPKTTQIAYFIKDNIKNKNLKIIETPSLNIHPCEGNISSKKGNGCGLKESLLKDKDKNPSGNHRCWCSLNNKDDELWKISKELFNSDCVMFFGSVRWGSMNSYYQKLIERLSWIENRHTTLGESNIVKNISAGLVVMGHNWNVSQVMEIQKQVLRFYGFKVEDKLCWSRQWTKDPSDETLSGYNKDNIKFKEII